jgi:hypothetical protein
MSCIIILLIIIDVAVVIAHYGVPLPLLLYSSGTRLQGR